MEAYQSIVYQQRAGKAASGTSILSLILKRLKRASLLTESATECQWLVYSRCVRAPLLGEQQIACATARLSANASQAANLVEHWGACQDLGKFAPLSR